MSRERPETEEQVFNADDAIELDAEPSRVGE